MITPSPGIEVLVTLVGGECSHHYTIPWRSVPSRIGPSRICPLTNCPLTKCPLTNCPVANCPLTKVMYLITTYRHPLFTGLSWTHVTAISQLAWWLSIQWRAFLDDEWGQLSIIMMRLLGLIIIADTTWADCTKDNFADLGVSSLGSGCVVRWVSPWEQSYWCYEAAGQW